MTTDLPNIVLIIMDSVPAKRCSAYGHERDTTPGLRRLASQGVLYRHCFAPATWTIPSHASLFSGLYPWDHGCNHEAFQFSPEQYYCLPEILKQSGYLTAALSSNQLICPEFNFHTGFDRFYSMEKFFNSRLYNEAKNAFKSFKTHNKSEFARFIFLLRYCWENRAFAFPVQDLLNRIYENYWGNISEASCHATARTVKISRKIMEKSSLQGKPFFLFINFMEAHAPYNPPDYFQKIFKINKAQKKEISQIRWTDFYLRKDITPENRHLLTLLYEQEIAYLDECIFALYGHLEQLGLSDDTLFIVTADHGEGLGEHRVWHHSFGLYNELTHIPLIIKYPSFAGLEGEEDRVVQLHDLFATILELLNCPLPAPMSSASLLDSPRPYAYAELADPTVSIHLKALKRADPDFHPDPDLMQPCQAVVDQGLRKLIRWADGRQELYDLKEDYGEVENLINDPSLNAVREDLASRLTESPGPGADLDT